MFRAVFASSSDTILLLDVGTRRLVDANPAACRLFGYPREALVGMRSMDLIHSEGVADYAAHAGEHEGLALVARRNDGSPIDVELFAHDFDVAGQTTRLNVVREITGDPRPFELLESRVAERTRQLSGLLEISRALTGTLELQPLLEHVLDRLAGVVEYTEALFMLVDGDDLCVAEYRGQQPRGRTLALRLPARVAPVFQAVLRERGAVIVDDLLGEGEVPERYRAEQFQGIDTRPPAVRSVLSVPLTIKDQIIGQLRLDHRQPGFYTRAHADLALAVANQAAIAIQRARLFESERAARERLEVAVAAGRLGTWDWDMRSSRVTWSTQLEAIHGLAPGTFGGTFEAYLADIHPDDRADVQETISRSIEQGDHHLEYRIIWPDGSTHWLGASGRVIRDPDGQPIGMLGVCQDITERKMEEEERARLDERERAASEARAALEERQRLARELHDSVSQALYGIALGTQTVLGALREDRAISAAVEAAEYVLKLAEASIVEMRALILELRPESLEQEGLVAALERHVASVHARHGLVVEARLDGEPRMPLVTKEALYRIAQEALHNATKHARARTIQVRLERGTDESVLEVADDGVGFDPRGSYPGHLGLTSMRERSAAVGGTLDIESAPGNGTRVRVRVPVGPEAGIHV